LPQSNMNTVSMYLHFLVRMTVFVICNFEYMMTQPLFFVEQYGGIAVFQRHRKHIYHSADSMKFKNNLLR
ncbi:hypothetical protein KC799_27215, partial [candidate division KSB1 bacterium]|nr:hypothetical protein [candidate division KSB1 bacterium]